MKVIISSALDEAEARQRCAGYEGLHFLLKSYNLEAVREPVQVALAA